MTDFSDDEINETVRKIGTVPKVSLTETHKLIIRARTYLSSGFDEDSDALIEELINKVKELDKRLSEMTDLYRKASKSASDAGWELDNARQAAYESRGRNTW